ncbi:MAG: hypothetical protein ABSD29_12590 [Verrucomicrobiota bacterium]
MPKPPPKLKGFDLVFLVEPKIRPCCGPIFFTRPLESGAPDDIIESGSFGLADTGTMKLLVTCHHVWDKFQELRRENPQLKMCLCLNSNSIVLLEPIQPIDQDENLDIASFDMKPFLEQCREIEFFRFNCSREPRVKRGDALAFVGFPGRIQAHTSIGVRFQRRFHVTRAYDVTDSRVVSDLTRLKPYRQEPKLVGLKDGYGGISGSPCFLVRQNSVLQLVALATDEALGILRFTLLNCLNSAGTINRGLPC